MSSTLDHGQAEYRTALMTLEMAKRFARCLARNSSRFTDVTVERSRRALPTAERRWAVRFRPVSDASTVRILAQKQKDRLHRAEAEGMRYLWVADEERPGTWMLLSCSGAVYEVTPEHGACDCPDHEIRCKPAGLRCKHLLAFDQGLGFFCTVEEFNTIPDLQKRWQEVHGGRSA